MTVYRSGTAGMRAYAWSRVHAADQALSAHRRDGAGCCASCGRVAPCEDATRAGQVREHYRTWLAGARTWVDADDAGSRIRPYVLAGLANDDHAA